MVFLMSEKKRKILNLNAELCDWFDAEAKEMGIPGSSLMLVALKQYQDQQVTLKSMNNMPDWMKDIEYIKSELKKAAKGSEKN